MLIVKTKAAILYKLNSPLIIDEVEVPSLKRGQVLVRILYSGVCRAQYNEIIGLKGPDRYLPHLLGHEGSGIVKEIGPGVSKVKKGDYVVLSWIKGNGLDALPKQYHRGKEIINAGAVTTFSHYSVVSENRVTKISKKMPADKAAVIGCAMATGGGIVNNTLNVKKNSSIAIFGVGGIGASAILAAKLRRCSKIIAIDIHQKKLAFAKKLGASHGILVNGKNIFSQIQKVAPGGVDYAIDASGAKVAMETAFEAINYTGTLVIAGNLAKDEKICLHPFELIKGKQIRGTWGGETVPQRDFPKYIHAYCSGQLPLDKLITHYFKLEDINHAFDLLRNGGAGRIIIEMTENKMRGNSNPILI